MLLLNKTVTLPITFSVDENTTPDPENTPYNTSEETTTAQEPKTMSTALSQKEDATSKYNNDIFFKENVYFS
jgi:hypothetical protein